jgi:hypothetical protein
MSHTFDHRNFMIFDMSELNSIDFNEVLETSEETVRKSIDETKSFVKWEGETIPPSVSSLTTKQGPYHYDEILKILETSEWTSNAII